MTAKLRCKRCNSLLAEVAGHVILTGDLDTGTFLAHSPATIVCECGTTTVWFGTDGNLEGEQSLRDRFSTA